jgi:hypothetical protein
VHARAAAAGRDARPRVIGLDEVSIKKGHTYRIVDSDLIRYRPIWFGGTGRSEASLDQFCTGLGPRKTASIRLVVMEMWKPFRLATARHAPQASILFDKFHVLRRRGDALDQVCNSEYAAAPIRPGCSEDRVAASGSRRLRQRAARRPASKAMERAVRHGTPCRPRPHRHVLVRRPGSSRRSPAAATYLATVFRSPRAMAQAFTQAKPVQDLAKFDAPASDRHDHLLGRPRLAAGFR